jgi:hypothetical protein
MLCYTTITLRKRLPEIELLYDKFNNSSLGVFPIPEISPKYDNIIYYNRKINKS